MPKEGDETDPLTVMETRAVRLKKARTSPCGWREVVHGTKEDIDLCPPTDVHWLRLKCRLVATALEIAMEKMPEQTWYECCDEAVRRVNEADGFVHVKMGKTVASWHRKFRILAEQFTNPAIVRM